MINLFFIHFIVYKQQYMRYFSIFSSFTSWIPAFFSVFQIPVIFLTISILSIIMNIYFGFYSMNLGRAYKWSRSFITILFHIIMIVNGIIATISFVMYMHYFSIELYSLFFSIIIALSIFSLFIYLLLKKELKYPYEAIYQYRNRNHKKRKEK
jgi:hypothetical protein